MPKSDNVSFVKVMHNGTWKDVGGLYRRGSSGWEEIGDAWTRTVQNGTVQIWKDDLFSSAHTVSSTTSWYMTGFFVTDGITPSFGSISPTTSNGDAVVHCVTNNSTDKTFFGLSGAYSSNRITKVRIVGNGQDVTITGLTYAPYTGTGSWYCPSSTFSFSHGVTYTVTLTGVV